MTLEGVLPILKPVDFTSHDVVAKLRGILGIKRIGHTGTLDPQVTGVLPLCIGRATRVVEYIQDLPKEYEATLVLGISTDTEDMTGKITDYAEQVHLSKAEINQAIISFQGTIEQIPPMYSAVKVNGKRLYELARIGVEIERKPRTVTIHSIEITHMDLEPKHPTVKFRTVCSKGTYIRTLCADIGKALGIPSAMSHLVRTATGNMTIGQCVTIQQAADLFRAGHLGEIMIPTDQAIAHLAYCSISSDFVESALQGKTFPVSVLRSLPPKEADIFRLYSPDGKFLGIFQTNHNSDTVTPVKVFS